jgi:acetyltransferase-like isoleucine patch superfamily enzyme
MAYYSDKELKSLGFKHIGENTKISDKASIYDHEKIEIGNNSRIDDFCIVSGNIKIGRHVHITPQCLLAGGEKGIFIEDFCTLAYGVKIFTQSDDYSGEFMVNSTIPREFKKEYKAKINILRQTIIGAGSIIMPGVTLGEGTSIGAMSLILSSTDSWSIYFGVPGKMIKPRSKKLLELEKNFLRDSCL